MKWEAPAHKTGARAFHRKSRIKTLKKPAKKSTAKAKIKTKTKAKAKPAVAKKAKKVAKAAVAKKSAPAKKSAAKKVAGKKAVAKKSPYRKVKPAAKKPAAKAASKAAVKKVAAKKSVARKTAPARKISAPRKVAAKTARPSGMTKTAERKLARAAKPQKLVAAAPVVAPVWPDMVEHVLKKLDEAKAEQIVAIDLSKKSTVADTMVVASGRSNRHVNAIADQVVEELKKLGQTNIRIEGVPQCDWVLVDAGDVVVHVFRPEVRSFYNLEKLWSAHAPQ